MRLDAVTMNHRGSAPLEDAFSLERGGGHQLKGMLKGYYKAVCRMRLWSHSPVSSCTTVVRVQYRIRYEVESTTVERHKHALSHKTSQPTHTHTYDSSRCSTSVSRRSSVLSPLAGLSPVTLLASAVARRHVPLTKVKV